MGVKRSILGVVGVLACTLAAVLATGSAQAAVPSNHVAGSHDMVLPSAPRGAESMPSQVVAAISPTITGSPAVPTRHAKPGAIGSCSRGDLCAGVWDPTTRDWKIFDMRACNTTYGLSHWQGNGAYFDNQTNNVVSHFYDQGRRVVNSFTPDAKNHPYNWDPIWYIKPC
jgi:hypothetical protein